MRLAAALAAVLLLGACSGSSSSSASGSLPDVALPTVSGGKQALKSCPTAQCVTAYVAPWCPHCRSTTPGLIALRDDLAKKGITVRVVVGMDKPEAVAKYASAFGPDAMLDPDNEFAVNGVPHFFVSDAQGRITGDYAGVVHDNATAQELAEELGMP